jgi:hypothetical protein
MLNAVTNDNARAANIATKCLDLENLTLTIPGTMDNCAGQI